MVVVVGPAVLSAGSILAAPPEPARLEAALLALQPPPTSAALPAHLHLPRSSESLW